MTKTMIIAGLSSLLTKLSTYLIIKLSSADIMFLTFIRLTVYNRQYTKHGADCYKPNMMQTVINQT